MFSTAKIAKKIENGGLKNVKFSCLSYIFRFCMHNFGFYLYLCKVKIAKKRLRP